MANLPSKSELSGAGLKQRNFKIAMNQLIDYLTGHIGESEVIISDTSLAPSGVSGGAKDFLSWIPNRIKAITGKTNWYDNPDASLKMLADCIGLWSALKTVVAGVVVVPRSGVSTLKYIASTDGTTASTEPTWPTIEGSTVVDGSVTWTAILVSGGSGAGGIGQGDFIAEGLSVVPGTGLQVMLNVGRGVISEKEVNVTEIIPIPLLKRRAQLAYLTKNKTVGVVGCKYPAYNDANMVVRYDMNHFNGQWLPLEYFPLNATIESSTGVYFMATTAGISGAVAPTWPESGTVADGAVVWTKQAGAGTYVPNSASAGVANNLTPSGTVSRVDGRKGFAYKGNGTNGYFASANATGIPAGTTPTFEVTGKFTYYPAVGNQYLWHIIGGQWFSYIAAAGNVYWMIGGTSYDTGYILETGKTYALEWRMVAGVTLELWVNGNKVYSVATSTNGSPTSFEILGQTGANGLSPSTVHYVELRNALRTPAQIATVAQEMLIPCAYSSLSETTLSPSMTSGSLPSGHSVSASSELATYEGWKAFDNNGSTIWVANAVTTNATLTRVYPSSVSICGYKILPRSDILAQSWASWKLEYSNDGGTTWILADSQTGQAISAWSAGFYNTYSLRSRVYGARFKFTVLTINGGSTTSAADIVFLSDLAGSVADICAPNLPADSMSVAYVEAGETAPTLIVDGSNPGGATPDWTYGIRVGPTGARNKLKFLGWKYFSGVATVGWKVDQKAKFRYVYAQDANGMNEVEVTEWSYNGTYYGIRREPAVADKSIITTWAGGVTYSGGAWRTSGYIGVYAEVID